MNALSTFAMKLNFHSKPASSRVQTTRQALGRTTVRHESFISEESNNSNGRIPSLHLGDTVRHARFGTGRVMAQLPDGRLQIRFEGVVKSQMIFPSLLQL
jgi:hypothetical protein